MKKILIGIGVVVLLIVLFFGAYGIKANSEIKKMDSAKTGKIVGNVFAIQDSFTNIYLINDNGQYIVIDAGNNEGVVNEEFKGLSVSPDSVIAVLLTHSDGDHVTSLKLFKNAKVYLSKQEEQMINGETSRFLFFGNKIDNKEYTLIEDQQTFTIGNTTIKGILTPGHTPGSMCYLINNKYLFTGDAISLKDGEIDKFNEFFNMDTEAAIKSMDIITTISEAEYIFSAHHGYTNDYARAVKNWSK